MTHDEAIKLFEHLEKMPKEVQLSYIIETFGDVIYDIVAKDWEEYDEEHQRLEQLKKIFIEKKVKEDFV
jgi:hypothetical protein